MSHYGANTRQMGGFSKTYKTIVVGVYKVLITLQHKKRRLLPILAGLYANYSIIYVVILHFN